MSMASELPKTPAFAGAETAVFHAVQWVHIALDAAGAFIVAVGAVLVFAQLIDRVLRRDTSRLTSIRLELARFLTLALEFQLAADVLATAIAPSWQEIGQLAAIAVIRTALNFSLTREIANERKEIGAEDDGRPQAHPVRKSNMSTVTP